MDEYRVTLVEINNGTFTERSSVHVFGGAGLDPYTALVDEVRRLRAALEIAERAAEQAYAAYAAKVPYKNSPEEHDIIMGNIGKMRAALEGGKP